VEGVRFRSTWSSRSSTSPVRSRASRPPSATQASTLRRRPVSEPPTTSSCTSSSRTPKLPSTPWRSRTSLSHESAR